MTKTQTTKSPTRGLQTRKGGHMATFHPTALFGTQTRAEVMQDELRDLESRLANQRYPFAGTVWHSRREAKARADYLRRALS